MRLSIWPQGLIGRVIIVLMFTGLIEFTAIAIMFERLDLRTARADQAHHLAEQLVLSSRVLGETPESRRPEIARELSTQTADVSWGDLVAPRSRAPRALQRLEDDMQRWEPALLGRDLQLDFVEADPLHPERRLSATARLSDGSWLRVSSRAVLSAWPVLWAGFGAVAVLSTGVLLAAALLVRNFGSPLRALARAADQVGQAAPLQVREEGAGDLRRVAQAFNAMQTRIGELLKARTHALTAVSHDLRTPLSRIRLRASFVAERETREALEQDVDEMSQMLDSLLAYLGGQEDGETPRRMDLAALCMTLVDAAVDAGHAAAYFGPEHLPAMVRASGFRRALDNLMQNAIAYGDRADVSLLVSGDWLVLRVEDNGPGIAAADLPRAIEAFERLDDARARNTGGLGLGLSIVNRIAEQGGGALTLTNRPAGGLRAELRLPRQA
jgi:signal transduction histidine kinase